MKKRYLYALLFGVPGLFLAGISSLFLFGASLGFLWLFVFGDNPWPGGMDVFLTASLVVVFLILWTVLLVLGYGIGQRLESDPTVNRMHIVISAGLTLAFIFIIFLQQLSVGNIGPKPDSVLCSDYCVEKGYAGSGMPPLNSGDRTCSCYDASGNEALRIPLDSLRK